MKKVISLLLALCLVFSLAACSKSKDDAPPKSEAGGGTGQNNTEQNPESGGDTDPSRPESSGDGENSADDGDKSDAPSNQSDVTYEKIIEGMHAEEIAKTDTREEGIWEYSLSLCLEGDGVGNASVRVDPELLSGDVEVPSFMEGEPVTSFRFTGKDISAITNIRFPEFLMTLNSNIEPTQWYQNLPDGPVYIGKVLYGYKGDMAPDFDLVVEDGTKVILGDAFKGCSNLRSVVLPDSVVYIGDHAFADCISLCKLELGNGIMQIDSAFMDGCQSLPSVFIPKSLIYIDAGGMSGTGSTEAYFEGSHDEYYDASQDSEHRTEAKIYFDCDPESYREQIAGGVSGTMTGLANLANLDIGSVVEFGSYEQDGDTSNGPEPIRWYVFSKEDGRALLLTESMIDAVPYFAQDVNVKEDTVNDRGLETRPTKFSSELIVTWEKSDLRIWLNDTFYNTAFSDEDKGSIIKSLISTPDFRGYTNGCPDTEDNVFVLTYHELEMNGTAFSSMEQAKYTQYAKAKTTDKYNSFWLRSNMAHETDEDSVDVLVYESYNQKAVNAEDEVFHKMIKNVGVRPAMWVRIP